MVNSDLDGLTRHSGLRRHLILSVERSLQNVPGLLDPVASAVDVLPVAVALQCVDIDDSNGSLPLQRAASSPAELMSLSSCRGPVRENSCHICTRTVVLLVFLFVALDTSKSLAVSWAAVHGRMCAPLVICSKNMLSIMVGMTLASVRDGLPGVRRCLDVPRSLKVLPIAGCFCAAQIFSLEALRAFDAGSLKIIAQVNLPTTALLSWLVLGRHYSGHQWLGIALLLVATWAFLQVRMLFFEFPDSARDDLLERMPDKVVGMLYFVTGIALSCLASVFAERFLKNRYDIPFYIQKTNLMFGELLAACLMVHFNGRGHSGEVCSWEQMMEWRQLPVIFIWLLHGWFAGLLVKRCSALVKNISHILSALVTYFLPLMMTSPGRLFKPVTLSALLVLNAVLIFATAPKPAKLARHKSSAGRAGRKSRKHTSDAESGEAGLKGSMSRASSDQFLVRKVQGYPAAQVQVMDSPSRSSRSLAAVHESPGHAIQRLALARPVSQGVGSDLALPMKRLTEAGGEATGRSKTQGVGSDLALPMKRLTEAGGEVAGRSKTQAASMGLLVVCFILLDALKPLLVTWAQHQKGPHERFIHGTFIFVQTSLSYMVGLVLACMPSFSRTPPHFRLHPKWRVRLRNCVDLHAVLQQLPCACCLCLSKLLLLMALGRLDAGTVRVFGQSSLPLVGVGSAFFFSKRYTAQQWSSLVAISVALVTFYYVKAEVRVKTTVTRPQGRCHFEVVAVLLILASICFNCLGALIVEKFLKGDRGRLHAQKAQLLLGEVLVNACLVFVAPLFIGDPELRAMHSPWHRGFFAGWDCRVLVCTLVWIPAGWTATILVKHCSNLLKSIAQSTSGVLTYVFSVVPLSSAPRLWSFFVHQLGPPLEPEPLSCPVVLLAIAVMLSALTFGTDQATEKHPRMQQWKVDPAYKHLQPQLLGVHCSRSNKAVEDRFGKAEDDPFCCPPVKE